MVAPYKRGEYFRNGYLSKASTVEEDHSKSSDDETRLSRETDIDDIGSVVEVSQEMRKNWTSPTLSLVNARKRKASSRRDIN